MNLRTTPIFLICAAALLMQGCVEYYPASAFNPPPQPPPAPTQYAEAPSTEPAPPPPPQAPGPDDALVAPIALYPDPLIALILPASTVPSDVMAASSYLIQYGDPSRVDGQPWDPSVRALAHYPTVIAWMAQNMAWTEALGSAFLSSPGDVMEAVQRLRARALASGALASTPQQQVYSEGGQIEIYPTQTDTVYVPVYDDSVVYSDRPNEGYGGPFVSFGEPCAAGPWLSFYFDWGRHRVWAGDQTVWREHNGWRPPHTGGNGPPPGAHPWRPPANRPREFQPTDPAHATTVQHPRPMPGAPSAPPDRFKRQPVQPNQTLAPPSRLAQPKTAPPPLGQAHTNAPGPMPVTREPRPPVTNPTRSLPPPPPRTSFPASSRGSESSAPRSAPARASAPSSPPAAAPAPAPNSTSQQPQK
jgi:hypothetical protein